MYRDYNMELQPAAAIRAGEYVTIRGTPGMAQVCEIFADTGQVRVYNPLGMRYTIHMQAELEPVPTLTSDGSASEEDEERLLLVSADGQSTRPGKRIKAKAGTVAGVVPLQMLDEQGGVVEAPADHVYADARFYMRADVMAWGVARGYFTMDMLKLFATKLNRAYERVATSELVWKTMLLRDFPIQYLHYLTDVGNGMATIDYLVAAIDRHSSGARGLYLPADSPLQDSRRLNKRLYEFWYRIHSAPPPRTPPVTLAKFGHGVKGAKALTKYFCGAYQCGRSIHVLMAAHPLSTNHLQGNYMFRVPFDTDLVEMFRNAAGSLEVAAENFIFSDKNRTMRVRAYDQAGVVLGDNGPEFKLYYYSEETHTRVNLPVAKTDPLRSYCVVKMTKTAISIAIYSTHQTTPADAVFVSYIFSRQDPKAPPAVLANVLICAVSAESEFLALDMNHVYLDAQHVPEWSLRTPSTMGTFARRDGRLVRKIRRDNQDPELAVILDAANRGEITREELFARAMALQNSPPVYRPADWQEIFDHQQSPYTYPAPGSFTHVQWRMHFVAIGYVRAGVPVLKRELARYTSIDAIIASDDTFNTCLQSSLRRGADDRMAALQEIMDEPFWSHDSETLGNYDIDLFDWHWQSLQKVCFSRRAFGHPIVDAAGQISVYSASNTERGRYGDAYWIRKTLMVSAQSPELVSAPVAPVCSVALCGEAAAFRCDVCKTARFCSHACFADAAHAAQCGAK